MVYPSLERRRTVRSYADRAVEEEKLARIVAAAALAPSAHHTRPWHLTLVIDPVAKRRLAEAMAAAWDNDLERAGVPEDERARKTASSIRRFAGAPVLVLASMDTRIIRAGVTTAQNPCEETMLIQSVAAAIYAVLIASAEEGLGAAWHCPPLFCPGEVREALRMPAYLLPQGLITIGYAIADPGPRPERSLDGAITWIKPERPC